MSALPWILVGGLVVLLYNKKKLTLGDFTIEAKRKSANDPETGGWAPGWASAYGGSGPLGRRFKSRAEAQALIKKYGKKGAHYRIKSLDGCGCDDF